MHCNMLSRDLEPPEGKSTPHRVVTPRSVSRHGQTSPGEQSLPSRESLAKCKWTRSTPIPALVRLLTGDTLAAFSAPQDSEHETPWPDSVKS